MASQKQLKSEAKVPHFPRHDEGDFEGVGDAFFESVGEGVRDGVIDGVLDTKRVEPNQQA